MKRWEGFNSILRFNKEVLKIFTAEQGNDIYKDKKIILAFSPLSGSRALLSSAFFNNGNISRMAFEKSPGYKEYSEYRKSIGEKTHSKAQWLYNLEVCSDLTELFDRVVIDWGKSAISWYQNNVDKTISEIMPDGFVMNFPGWDKVNITHQELKAIINKPDGNSDWHEFLSRHHGVYMLLDNKTGRHYIGSATGKDGLWGRWSGYARTGHNNNKYLKELVDKYGESYPENFSYSLHHVFSAGSATRNEVVKNYEYLLMKKMGSRVFQLN